MLLKALRRSLVTRVGAAGVELSAGGLETRPQVKNLPHMGARRHAVGGGNLRLRRISEHQLKRQLQKPRLARAQNLPEGRRFQIVLGQAEIRMIQQIEALGAKLEAP